MLHQVKLPKLGDTTQVALIAEWLCSVGDRVQAGDSLVLVETDKVETEVPAPVAGMVVEQLIAPQEEVPVGTVICVIEDDE